MLNRRLLRIKVFQALYAFQQDESKDQKAASSYLERSITKVEDEYAFLLSLPADIRYYVENEINPEEILYAPTKKDVETGKTFIYNQLISIIEQSEDLKKKAKKAGISWLDNKEELRMVFNGFKTSVYFQKYLENPVKDFFAQKELLLNFYKEYLQKHEETNVLMEEFFIHWNDDKKAVFNCLIKTIESIEHEESMLVMSPLSEDYKEDWEFCTALLRKVIAYDETYSEMISAKTKKWDTERIADIDMILMKMSICELMEFPTIPLKVSINEYIDISKIYSTPKSNIFLNGVLDKIMNELKAAGKINKTGRGLIE
jgi:N utilization substance protein B